MVTAFKKAPGVLEATTDFKAKTATVKFDPSKTDVAKLSDALKGTDFTATLKENAAKTGG